MAIDVNQRARGAHPIIVLEMLEEHGDDENGDDRRQGDAYGTHNASPDSLRLIADMTRHCTGT